MLPKMNVILGPWFETEFFANYGEGITVTTPAQPWPGLPLTIGESEKLRSRYSLEAVGPDGAGIDRNLVGAGPEAGTVFVGRCRDDGDPRVSRPARPGSRGTGQVWGPLYFNGSA